MQVLLLVSIARQMPRSSRRTSWQGILRDHIRLLRHFLLRLTGLLLPVELRLQHQLSQWWIKSCNLEQEHDPNSWFRIQVLNVYIPCRSLQESLCVHSQSWNLRWEVKVKFLLHKLVLKQILYKLFEQMHLIGTARRLFTPFWPISTRTSSVYGFSHWTGPTRLWEDSVKSKLSITVLVFRSESRN